MSSSVTSSQKTGTLRYEEESISLYNNSFSNTTVDRADVTLVEKQAINVDFNDYAFIKSPEIVFDMNTTTTGNGSNANFCGTVTIIVYKNNVEWKRDSWHFETWKNTHYLEGQVKIALPQLIETTDNFAFTIIYNGTAISTYGWYAFYPCNIQGVLKIKNIVEV